MQLNDLLEENSVKSISKKTNISEENIERLIQKDFASLKRVKTLGFISILEREYHIDLQPFRQEALDYYQENEQDPGIVLAQPSLDEKRPKSKLIPLIILGLLAYASWYFFTQFDQKHLSDYLPFGEHSSSEEVIEKPAEIDQSLRIENAISQTEEKADKVLPSIESVEENQSADAQTNVTQSSTVPQTSTSADIETAASPIESKVKSQAENIAILPTGRLWFGLVDMESKQRDHYSVAQKFDVDVRNKSWLVATSSAPFSLIVNDETKTFNDAKEHYFRFDQNGIEELSKKAYIQSGGYPKW